MRRRLFASFSGGETSAYMTRLLLTDWRHLWDEIVVVFANTGEENEETLEFVDRCDRDFGFNTVWVEALVDPEKGSGTTHQVVDFATASRRGEPFEAVIKKYGIPNTQWPHCTRELKTRPMYSYVDSLGWEAGTFDVAIGIRKDEEKRRKKSHVAERIVYPLIDQRPTTKPMVNKFWMAQAFRLRLAGYQGNCKTCWKKSTRKHMTLMSENPRLYDFFQRMEARYGAVGPEIGRPETPYTHRVFFRGSLSTKDLRAAYELNKETLEKAEDDSIVLPNGSRILLDIEPEGCVEACEMDGVRTKEAA